MRCDGKYIRMGEEEHSVNMCAINKSFRSSKQKKHAKSIPSNNDSEHTKVPQH